MGTNGVELLRPAARAGSAWCQLPVFLAPQDDTAEIRRPLVAKSALPWSRKGQVNLGERSWSLQAGTRKVGKT